MQEQTNNNAALMTYRTCRDSLLRARLARVRETQDEARLREAQRELQQSLAPASLA